MKEIVAKLKSDRYPLSFQNAQFRF